ncbi:MAG: hypothetical protein LBT89_09725, partial [Planctomycetaceae bacterium]|nr:hypothetical protein [Planctomycetaceae bacterium]
MVKQNLVRELDINEDFDSQIDTALGGTALDEINWGGKEVEPNKIYEGRVARLDDDFIVVDIGCKSEGIVPTS